MADDYNLELGDAENVPEIQLDLEDAENVPEIELEMSVPDSVHEYNAEAWAVGERHGDPVSSSDPAYHNNAKYYAGAAAQDATDAAGAKTDAEAARDAAQAAALHYPYVDPTTGNWMVWDPTTGAFVNTNVHAQGATGAVPNISVGTVTTLQPGSSATVERRSGSPDTAPVFDFGIPKGDAGSVSNIYATTIPMSDQDSTKISEAIGGKTDKVASATSGNFAGLDANGNLTDSGKKASDFLTAHQDITGKADKVNNATSGNFAGLDANGNLTDSGKKASDFLTAHQDITGKADKVSGATSGNFAGLDSDGNLTDSGKRAKDFENRGSVAYVQADNIAGRNYSIGDYITLANGDQVKATAAISIGDTLGPNNTYPVNGGVANDLNAKKVSKSDFYGTEMEIVQGSNTSVYQALSDNSQAISETQAGIAIVVDGNMPDGNAAVGQYVLVKNSTMSGAPDGAYVAASAITAGVAIDATYLTAKSDGFANALKAEIAALNANLSNKLDASKLRYEDKPLTTGTSKFGNFYYADYEGAKSDKAKVFGAFVVSSGSNHPAFAMVTGNGTVRVFAEDSGSAVTVRIVFKDS